MRDRLGRAPEQQADAHAGGEQHGEPGHRRKLRLVVVLTQLDTAVAGKGKPDANDQHEADGQHDEPGAAGELYADQVRGKSRKPGGVDDAPGGDGARDDESD